MSWWGVGAAVVGGLLQSDSASDAADTQAQSSAEAIAEQRRQFDLNRGDTAPYRAAGTNALQTLQADNGQVNPADVMSDPGYQFGLDQGQQGLDRKFSAMGGRASGAALKAASRYATDYAASGYGAAYQRKQDRLNRLAAIAGIGQTSAGAGSAQSNSISNLITAQGNAAGAAQISSGNIWGGVANQIGAIGSRWANQPASTPPPAGYGANGGYTYGNGALYEGPG